MYYLSVEELNRDIYICRWHRDSKGFGTPYIASCVLHFEEVPYIKILTIKGGVITKLYINQLKEYFGIDILYFKREKDAFKTREI